MLKKTILSLAAMLAVSTTANAAYSDFSYKHSNIGSYMFGIYGGGGYTDADFGPDSDAFFFEGGLNTFYMYEATERFNLGVRAAIKYVSDDLDFYDEYKMEVEPFIGYKISPQTNLYVGYGMEFWNEIETDYLLIGADYFFSENLMLELKFKRKNFTQFENIEAVNNFQLNAVIPFNFY